MAGSERQIVRDYRKAQKQKILAGIAAGTMTKQDLSHFNATNRRHQMFDAVKAVVRLTQRKNPYTETGNRFERDGMQFENKGRIMIGGTKPMYQYQDSKGQVWLMKEAITAIGTKKPMGALVSEAAFRIQNLVEPESAIPTFVRRSADGKVVHGSFQARVDVDKNAIDLFQWQRDGKGVLTDSLKKQILREHVTDWLLCNFDTKGENFLIDTDGRLRGIDKEQAFSYLYEKEAQHLSYDYSPNPNKTLYDTVFQMYANGDKNMDLDLGGNYQYIRKLSQMPDQEYMNIFRDVIDAKCKGDTAKADKMYEAILGRKQNLETEYGEFYGKLVRERFKDKSRDMLTENGQFSFEGREAGASQRIAREASRAKQSRGAEAMKERLEERRKVFLRSRNEKVSVHYQAIHDVLGKITELAELDVNRENRDKLERIRQDYRAASDEKEKLGDAYRKLEQCFLDAQAGLLARELKEGEACPVCGSLHHPLPARIQEHVPEKDELEAKKQLLSAAEEKAARLSTNAGNLGERLEEQWRKIGRLRNCLKCCMPWMGKTPGQKPGRYRNPCRKRFEKCCRKRERG